MPQITDRALDYLVEVDYEEDIDFLILQAGFRRVSRYIDNTNFAYEDSPEDTQEVLVRLFEVKLDGDITVEWKDVIGKLEEEGFAPACMQELLAFFVENPSLSIVGGKDIVTVGKWDTRPREKYIVIFHEENGNRYLELVNSYANSSSFYIAAVEI